MSVLQKTGVAALVLSLLPQFGEAQSCSAGPESVPASRFVAQPDGTLKDQKLNVLWRRCLVGQNASKNGCSGKPKLLDLQQALAFAKAEKPAGWRLPSQDELLSLVESRCSGPALNPKVFGGIPSTKVWAITQPYEQGLPIWAVDFADGFDDLAHRSQAHAVWLLRSNP
jgi:hypothetical protein